MSRKSSPPENSADTSASTPAPSVLEGVAFTAPMLRIIADTLGRYLRHDDGCPSGEACACGLVAAIAEVQRRELLFRRYGME